MEYIAKTEEDTLKFAKDFANTLCPGDIICLYGDLGAGKTKFCQGLAKGLGIDDYVNSPTFTIVNEYEGRMPMYHFDVYRINDIDEMYEIGFDEYIFSNGVSVIEWAELIEEIIPTPNYKITIKKSDDDYNIRKIIVKKRQ